jgi:serine/threonine protein kinase
LTSLGGPLNLISPFYILEPLPMITLADYAAAHKVTRSLLFEKLPNVLNTLSALHALNFPYLNLSTFSIVVDDTFRLRPPPLNPFDFPTSMLPRVPDSVADVDDTRLYQAPEWNCIPPSCSSDCWSLAAILAELLVFNEPLFASRDRCEQMERTQAVLGRAPSFVEWPTPPSRERYEPLPDLLVELLDYDPERRPRMCVHITQRILAFIHKYRTGRPAHITRSDPALYGVGLARDRDGDDDDDAAASSALSEWQDDSRPPKRDATGWRGMSGRRAASEVRRDIARIGRSFDAKWRDKRERVLQESSEDDQNSEWEGAGAFSRKFDGIRGRFARPDRGILEGSCVGCAVAGGLDRSLGRQRRAFCRPHPD